MRLLQEVPLVVQGVRRTEKSRAGSVGVDDAMLATAAAEGVLWSVRGAKGTEGASDQLGVKDAGSWSMGMQMGGAAGAGTGAAATATVMATVS